MYPPHHPGPSSTDQVGGASIGGGAGGVLYTGHALVQVGHQGGHTGGLTDATGGVRGSGETGLEEGTHGTIAFSCRFSPMKFLLSDLTDHYLREAREGLWRSRRSLELITQSLTRTGRREGNSTSAVRGRGVRQTTLHWREVSLECGAGGRVALSCRYQPSM